MDDNDGFRELSRQECLRLLAKAPVGRVVFTRHALPAVLPVTFWLDGDAEDGFPVWVVFRAPAASRLASAVDGVVLAFEADDVDATARSGWSVVVTGTAEVVTDPALRERLAGVGPRSWVAAPEEVFVRVEAALVTGRELVGGRTGYGGNVSA